MTDKHVVNDLALLEELLDDAIQYRRSDDDDIDGDEDNRQVEQYIALVERLKSSSSGVTFCVRHPDYDNEYTSVGEVTPVIDIDLGRSDILGDSEETVGWIESHIGTANELRAEGNVEAADTYESIIRESLVYDFDQTWVNAMIWAARND